MAAAVLVGAAIMRLLSIDPRHERVRLAEHVSIAETPRARWTIADVSTAPMAARFRARGTPTSTTVSAPPHTGYGSGWRPLGTPTEWFLEIAYRGLDEVELYVPDGHGGFSVSSAGDRKPFGATGGQSLPGVQLALRGPETTVLLLRVASAGPVVVPLELWSAEAFRRHQQVDNYALGILCGVLVALAIQACSSSHRCASRPTGGSFLAIASLVTGDLVEAASRTSISGPTGHGGNHSLLVLLALAAVCFIRFSRHYLDTLRALSAPRSPSSDE
ncbi:MAG: 7TM-DISM domain-containing protein [bacterium]